MQNRKSKSRLTRSKTQLSASLGRRPDEDEQKSHDFGSWEGHDEDVDDAELSVLSTQQISSDQQVSAYSSGQESVGASQVPSGRDSLGDKNDETDASGSGPDSIYEK